MENYAAASDRSTIRNVYVPTASICLAIILMLIEVLLLGGDESPGVATGLSAIARKTVLYGIVLLLGKNNSSLDDGQTQSAIRLLASVDKALGFKH